MQHDLNDFGRHFSHFFPTAVLPLLGATMALAHEDEPSSDASGRTEF